MADDSTTKTTGKVPPRTLGAFTAPPPAVSRGAAVPSLPARPAPPAPPPPVVPAGPPRPVPAPVRPPAAGGEVAPARRTRRQAAKAVDQGPISDGVGVHLGVGLHQRLRAYRLAHPGTTYTSIALDALEALTNDAGQLVVDLFPDTPRRSGPLFVGKAPKQVVHEDPRTQITVRPGPVDRATLDRLTEQAAAPNRSALIAAALDRYLPGGAAGQ